MERAGEMNDDRTAFHTIYKEQWLRLVLPKAVKKQDARTATVHSDNYTKRFGRNAVDFNDSLF
jgi:hypothetical protein